MATYQRMRVGDLQEPIALDDTCGDFLVVTAHSHKTDSSMGPADTFFYSAEIRLIQEVSIPQPLMLNIQIVQITRKKSNPYISITSKRVPQVWSLFPDMTDPKPSPIPHYNQSSRRWVSPIYSMFQRGLASLLIVKVKESQALLSLFRHVLVGGEGRGDTEDSQRYLPY